MMCEGMAMVESSVCDEDAPRLVRALGRRAKEVNLNLVWDYPVFWSKYKVLRDLIQNFYDAVGPAEWHRRFRVHVEGDTLHLRADATGFSYEWLLHIGASTKREQPGEFAGHFGEGFKIAALCAARDFHWNVELASRGWDLRVAHGEARIEGKSIRTLAYRVWDGLPARTHTELCLWPFAASDGDVLQAALVSFFYAENPLLGEKLWEDATAAVYQRSEVARPQAVPTTYEHTGSGVVFVGRQALGSVRYPVVLALHGFHQIDRERNALHGWQVLEVWRSVASRMDADAAITLLVLLRGSGTRGLARSTTPRATAASYPGWWNASVAIRRRRLAFARSTRISSSRRDYARGTSRHATVAHRPSRGSAAFRCVIGSCRRASHGSGTRPSRLYARPTAGSRSCANQRTGSGWLSSSCGISPRVASPRCSMWSSCHRRVSYKMVLESG